MKYFEKFEPQYPVQTYASEYGNTLYLNTPINVESLDILTEVAGSDIGTQLREGGHRLDTLTGGEVQEVIDHLVENAVPCWLELETEYGETVIFQIRSIDGHAYVKTHNTSDEKIDIKLVSTCLEENHIVPLMLKVEEITGWMRIEPFTEVDKAIFQAYLLNQKLGLTK